MGDFTSPNTQNYQIPKGNVYFTPDGGTRYHLGNCPEATFQIQTDKLDHFSAMEGIKKKDFSATLSVTGTLTLALEELTAKNLRLALLGSTPAVDNSTAGGGDIAFNIGAVESVTGKIEIIGSNDVGPKWNYDFPKVTLTPSDAVSFIGEDYAALHLTGEVLAVSGSFGKAILQESGTA